jgi:cation:H+ antiporter
MKSQYNVKLLPEKGRQGLRLVPGKTRLVPNLRKKTPAMSTLLLLIGGFIFLVAGAEFLVRGASKLATAIGISPLVVGLTVVAYGTSAPEMAVSALSSYSGQADISLGNVIGSNIFNVLFILGISAMIAPLIVSQQLVRLDVPVMIGISVVVLLMALDGILSRLDGVLLLVGAGLYTTFLIYQSRKETKSLEARYPQKLSPTHHGHGLKQWGLNLGLIGLGLGMLVSGSSWLVDSAVTIAEYLGVSQLIIGLTIVAIGTSLPEVATSIVASIRGERDIAVGNVIGSNIFNLLAVLGIAGVVSPTGVHISNAVIRFEMPLMIAVAFACLPIFFTGHVISRWEGALFFGYYLAYTAYLVLAATEHDALPIFSEAMIWFVMPLTALTLIIVTVQALLDRYKSASAVI